jgi:hypothetical protein
MKKRLMVGLWQFVLKVPPSLWEKRILTSQRRFQRELAFMTEEHRRVHHLVVRELPGHARPMTPGFVADRLGMGIERVVSILGDLDEHMTFICRDRQGRVVWAYPVTVEETPHHVTFDTGEQVYAA